MAVEMAPIATTTALQMQTPAQGLLTDVPCTLSIPGRWAGPATSDVRNEYIFTYDRLHYDSLLHIITFHYYIVITSLLHHYYVLLHLIITYYYIVIITSLLRHYYIIITSL